MTRDRNSTHHLLANSQGTKAVRRFVIFITHAPFLGSATLTSQIWRASILPADSLLSFLEHPIMWPLSQRPLKKVLFLHTTASPRRHA